MRIPKLIAVALYVGLITTPAWEGTAQEFSAPQPLGIFLGIGHNGFDLTNVHEAVGDFNNDGREDAILFLANDILEDHPATPLMVVLNDGAGKFHDGTNEVFVGSAPKMFWAKKFIIRDLNGDGQVDIYVAGHGLEVGPDPILFPTEQNQLFLSRPDGRLENVTATNLPQLLDFSHDATAADVDNDGDVDIFVANLPGECYPPPYLLLNDGNGKFEVAADTQQNPECRIVGLNGRFPTAISAMTNSGVVQFIDADQDGDADLFFGYIEFCCEVSPRGGLLLNDGFGRFTFAPEGATPKSDFVNPFFEWVDVADINKDGRDDVVVHVRDEFFGAGYAIQVLISNGDGTFRDETATRLPAQIYKDADFDTCGQPRFWLTDINFDGQPEIMTRKAGENCENPIIDFNLNDGNGFFSRSQNAFPELDPNFIPIDADGDGDPDFLDLGGKETVDGEHQLFLTINEAVPPDGDSDGIADHLDNCPTVSNPSQANTDGDALGDACDPDDPIAMPWLDLLLLDD